MKKFIYIIISIVFTGLCVSCEDFLEAPSQSTLDESLIFSNPTLAASAIDGIKEPIGQTNSYRGRYLTHYGANTDIEWFNNSQTAGARSDLSRYVNSSINTDMNTANNAWAQMYSGIERANICIRGLRTYGNPAPGTEMGQLLGEALTLRAIYYADLVKAWGDVVARFEPISSETMYLPKSSRDVIYKQLIEDLGEASELVGWPNDNDRTTTTEGINRAFVKAFRARICMAAAGYSQYPDGIRRSNDPDLSVSTLYPVAMQECIDVITSGKASLESSFERFWRKVCEENITAGGESLWEIPFADGRGRMAFTFAVRHASADQYTEQPRGGDYGPLPNVFYDYDVKDTRRDVTCVPYSWGTATNKVSKQTINTGNGVSLWYFGKLRYEWMIRYVTSTNDDGLNEIYMRYAEVLLMAAEIQNELGNLGPAKDYLKQVRQRAFAIADRPVKVDAYLNAITTKEQMFNAIVNEHAFEFCGEMERKAALIRWNLLGSKINEAKTRMTSLSNREGIYADVPEKIYYRYASDGESLQFYGLNRGETDDRSADYTFNTVYVSTAKLGETKINSLFTNNPDQNQFWPIWQVFIDASNGTLKNDYGY
ncbi:MAG: RagB/SusD family nutrient uptake outer membrane protein [Bacteroidales bacterium]